MSILTVFPLLFASAVLSDVARNYPPYWKANDRKPAECKARAEIHSNTIIRTKDSKAKGAIFLNETALAINNRDLCTEICCQTPRCTVSVYEEKDGGNCYLFDCGTGDSFRCKFTDHSYYTVAILQPIVESAEEDELFANNVAPQQESHENELMQLKRQRTEETRRKYFAEVATTLPTTSQRPVCGRFQFPCHRSGECIAIYNVCDGIPQCDDESDEDPRGCTNFLASAGRRKDYVVAETTTAATTVKTTSAPHVSVTTTIQPITSSTSPPAPIVTQAAQTVVTAKAAHAHYEVLHVDQVEVKKVKDQQARETTGAVWALALGLNVLVIFVIVIAFRFKSLRRKAAMRNNIRATEFDDDEDEDPYLSGLRL